jgi:O-antigen/teichoic acid export membrane protein
MTSGVIFIRNFIKSSSSFRCATGSGEAGLRARWRDRQAAKTGAAGVAVQAVNYGMRLVIVPLSIGMLGVEQYGLWLAVGSLVAWGGLSELGLAPGLVNVVARARGQGNREAMRRAISTALATYSLMALAMAALSVALSRWSELPHFLGARGTDGAENARLLVLICGWLFAASMLTRVVTTTTAALQEGYLGAYWQVGGSLASLALLLGLAGRGGGLLSYALVVSVPPLCADLTLAIYLFGWRHRNLRPGWEWCDRASLASLWGVAGPLTLVQFASIAGLYSANLLIGNRLGTGAIPSYAVPYSLFAAVNSTIWLLIWPFLPAFVEAASAGDWAWVRNRMTRMLGLGLGFSIVAGTALVLGGGLFVRIWTSGKVQPGPQLLIALFIFSLMDVGSAMNCIFLQAIGLVRLLAGTYCCVAVAAVVGSWMLLPIVGVIAIPLVGVVGGIARLLLTFPPAVRVLRTPRSSTEVLGAT